MFKAYMLAKKGSKSTHHAGADELEILGLLLYTKRAHINTRLPIDRKKKLGCVISSLAGNNHFVAPVLSLRFNHPFHIFFQVCDHSNTLYRPDHTITVYDRLHYETQLNC